MHVADQRVDQRAANVVVAVVVERVTDADQVQKRAQVLRAGTCEQMLSVGRIRAGGHRVQCVDMAHVQAVKALT